MNIDEWATRHRFLFVVICEDGHRRSEITQDAVNDKVVPSIVEEFDFKALTFIKAVAKQYLHDDIQQVELGDERLAAHDYQMNQRGLVTVADVNKGMVKAQLYHANDAFAEMLVKFFEQIDAMD